MSYLNEKHIIQTPLSLLMNGCSSVRPITKPENEKITLVLVKLPIAE